MGFHLIATIKSFLNKANKARLLPRATSCREGGASTCACVAECHYMCQKNTRGDLARNYCLCILSDSKRAFKTLEVGMAVFKIRGLEVSQNCG